MSPLDANERVNKGEETRPHPIGCRGTSTGRPAADLERRRQPGRVTAWAREGVPICSITIVNLGKAAASVSGLHVGIGEHSSVSRFTVAAAQVRRAGKPLATCSAGADQGLARPGDGPLARKSRILAVVGKRAADSASIKLPHVRISHRGHK